MSDTGVRIVCGHCKKGNCKRIMKIPLGTPIKKVVLVCARCFHFHAQAVRAWLDKLEKELPA